MSSNKSIPRPPVIPQRQNGKKRFAELLAAGKAVIAEKGFEATTMAEIAARAGAPIGSLYRFFPNKDAVADALIQESQDAIGTAFNALAEQASGLSTDALADALLALWSELRGRVRATLVLSEEYASLSAWRKEFRGYVLAHLTEVLRTHRPDLEAGMIQRVAFAVLLSVKVFTQATSDPDRGAPPGAADELRIMLRLYLADRLG